MAAAEYFGYEFKSGGTQTGCLEVADKASGETHVIEVLQTIPYESSRKRMSVIVRLPPALLESVGGGVAERLYCKGADSVLMDRLDKRAAGNEEAMCAWLDATMYDW